MCVCVRVCVQANLFCEESLQKIDAKDVERLKAMITLKQANTSVWKLRWLGYKMVGSVL